MTTTGEKTFSAGGRSVTKFQFTPPKPGDYDLKIRGSSVAIGCKQEPGAVPYVKVQLEALGSADEGGRNKILFHMFWLSTEPGAGGKAPVDFGGQITDLLKAMGEDAALPLRVHNANVKVGKDASGNYETVTKDIDIIDPEALKKFLADHDGMIVRGKVRNRKRDDNSVEGVVANFIATEGGNPFA